MMRTPRLWTTGMITETEKASAMKAILKGALRVRINRDVTHFVRQWRKHRGLSIVELGEAAGVSASMISQLETGKANYTQVTLESLAKALRVHPAALVWADPAQSELAWCDLVRGWERYNGNIENSVLDVLINDGVEGALKAAHKSARTLVEQEHERSDL